MREAKEIKRLGSTQTSRPSTRGRIAAELDQACLVRVQLQRKPRKPLTKFSQEPLRIIFLLEPDNEVVGEPHDDHITARVPAPPPVGPQVEDIVQVDVGEQR